MEALVNFSTCPAHAILKLVNLQVFYFAQRKEFCKTVCSSSVGLSHVT